MRCFRSRGRRYSPLALSPRKKSAHRSSSSRKDRPSPTRGCRPDKHPGDPQISHLAALAVARATALQARLVLLATPSPGRCEVLSLQTQEGFRIFTTVVLEPVWKVGFDCPRPTRLIRFVLRAQAPTASYGDGLIRSSVQGASPHGIGDALRARNSVFCKSSFRETPPNSANRYQSPPGIDTPISPYSFRII